MTEQRPEKDLELLGEIFKRRNIRYGLFDVDGTLLNTPVHFDGYLYKFAHSLASMNGDLDQTNDILDLIDKASAALRPRFGVNPAILRESVRVTTLAFGQDYYSEPVQANLDKLMQVYETAPATFRGVHQQLDILKKSGLELTIATHSEKERTHMCLAKNGLLTYFDSRIFCFDTWGEKGFCEWKSVVNSLGAKPDELIIAGDDILHDIIPNLEIGVPPEQVFRILTPYNYANLAEPPEGVKEISEFSNLHYAIIENLA